eukprot:g4899.t1
MASIVNTENTEGLKSSHDSAKEVAFEKTMLGYTNLIFNNKTNSSTIDELENIIESSLVRADELRALLNTVKNDCETATDVLLPQLVEHCGQLVRVFRVIDALEEVVSSLKSSATELNGKLDKVQKVYDLRHPSSLGRLFGKLARSSSLDNNVKEKMPPMPKWEGDEFIKDTSAILKEARLAWLDSASTITKEENSDVITGRRSDSIDV